MHFKVKAVNLQIMYLVFFYHAVISAPVLGTNSCNVIKFFVMCVLVVTENIDSYCKRYPMLCRRNWLTAMSYTVNCLIVVKLPTLSVGNLKRMDNKSDKMWKEAVVAYFDKLFGSLLEVTKKSCQ